MSRFLNGRGKPSIPKVPLNGWGPEYPIGMTDVDLLLFSPTVYDLYRTNGGMGSGMVDYFAYDPITQYGNLSSNVALAGGSSDLWFSLMNHRYPYRKYPFTSVENMESNYNNPKQLPMSGIEEMTGTGFFRSLNQESESAFSTTTQAMNQAALATAGKGGATSPTMIPTTTPPPTSTTPKTCPPGKKLVYGKCVPIIAVSGSSVVPTATVISSRPPASSPTPTPTPVVVPVPVPVAPAMGGGGGAIGGGGGAGGEAPAEARGEKGAEMGVEKVKYTIPLIIAVLGAVGGYFYAKKAGKKVAVFAFGGAVLGFAAGYFYTKYKMKKDAESASKAAAK